MMGRLYSALLRGASWLVPAGQRGEWLDEWRAEVFYVPLAQRARFCAGAYCDAVWMRWNRPASPGYLNSPWRCLLYLAAGAALSVLFAFRMEPVRSMLVAPDYARDPNMVTIAPMPVAQFDLLAESVPGKLFSRVAFYRPTRTSVAEVSSTAPKPVVVYASRNLFRVLRLKAPPLDPNGATVVLAENAWGYFFHRDPNMVGRRLTLGGQQVKVAAILPDRLWQLPGYHPDVWLLVDDATLAALPGAKGYAVGHLTSSMQNISLRSEDGGSTRFYCIPVRESGEWIGIVVMLGVAFLLPPMFMRRPVAESAFRHRLSMGARLRRFAFFVAKVVLGLTIAWLGTLDLLLVVAPAILPHGLLVGTVLMARWVLMDQRMRCPVCLRQLTNPTSIGGASNTFLDWYGTELVCLRGHGLLQVPEIDNSYSTSTWLQLDSSWSSLFL